MMFNTKVRNKIVFLVNIFLIQYTECYNILGVFPYAARSHYELCSKLMKGLAEAGHDVYVIMPYKLKTLPTNGTYVEIIVEKLAENYNKHVASANYMKWNNQSIIERLTGLTHFFLEYTNDTLHDLKVKEFLKSNIKFDAVITEHLFNDALAIFAHIYKCPLINLVTTGPNGWINYILGHSQPIAYVPHTFLPGDYTKGMTFFQRIRNLMYFTVEYFWHRYCYMPIHEKTLRNTFPEAPSVWELAVNVSIVLLNSHTSIHQPMPTAPNMVEIGGYHIDSPQMLPEDLQTFLDNAMDGIIYFSLGSIVQCAAIPTERLQLLIRVFKRLKQKVLWKCENGSMVSSENILVKNWVPQRDLLAHPNVRLFITHAGIASVMEAVYEAVPLLVMPMFYDQPMNAQKVVQSGFGLQLGYYDDKNFNEERLFSLIIELLENPKYKQNAQRVSKIFHDRPLKPMKTAVYWVEYAIRQNGTKHLRVDGVTQFWYQNFMIDVIGLLLIGIIILLYICKSLISLLIWVITLNNYRKKNTRNHKLD